ncbi:5-oxoprolinase subunit B family protein [Nocardioides caldifontis]|uniref:5-oxoprolinase subunit B family protein n=1 Tax=Nocardioides caldifontis TaxID=2588938 RepID=UPI0011E03F65|nr:allophanate hydrolase subunit 1 [Nocardioides caldifontis]
MRVLPVGVDALLVEVASAEEATSLYAAARSASVGARVGVGDVVPAARTVLFDGVRDREALERWLAGVDLAARPADERRDPVVLPTVYDGEDLDDVARAWGMTRAEAVATHSGTEFTVAFCGFAPGFAYCTGLPEELAVPRLERPRVRVPAGSVGVAGPFTGVYPRTSPGGWRLLGRTDARLWDAAAEPPALLAPGTVVRFEEVS